jgi:hypothetical protein
MLKMYIPVLIAILFNASWQSPKAVYNSDKISFICEDVATKKYKHYNE